MSQLSTGRSDRIVLTVGRLRQVLSDFAEQGPDLRRQFLADEVDRALSLVDRSEQRSFVEELRGRYAATSRAVGSPLGDGPSGSESGNVPGSELGNVSGSASGGNLNGDGAVLELLDSTLVELGEEVARGSSDPAVSEEQAVQELCAALGIARGGIDPVRAIAMASMMAQFSNSMTTLAWMAWRTIAPNSSVRRGGISQKLIARYVAGDQGVSREQVAGEVERLRQLVAALISAISQVGEQFARAHLEKFGPVEIEQAVIAENRGGMFRSREVMCWRKYIELAESLDQSAIESEIRRVIAQHAEHLMRGISRT